MARKARSRRSFGAIRKLPSGRYQASYTGPDLARHTAPQTFAAQIDAEQWLYRQRDAVTGEDWTPPSAPKPQSLTIAAYAEAWLVDRDLKPRTRHHYRYLLDKHLLPTFGAVLLVAVTPASIRTWHATLDTGPTARAHAYALLKSILSTAVQDEILVTNPAKIRGASKAKQVRQVKPATLDELSTITDAMPERLRLLVPLSAWCALRFGEAAELRRKDIDLAAGVVHVRRAVVRVGGRNIVDKPKSAAGVRDVHIPPHLLGMIRSHLHEHAQIGRDGLLFYGVKGAQVSHSSLLWQFDQAAEAAGRPDLTPHALRHTGAVLAAQSGATLAELMARLGHTTPAMAMRYQHASADRDLVLAQALSAMATRQHGE